MGVLDHAKETVILSDTVNGPRGIKDVMSAMLGVDLRKHEQLNVVLLKSVFDFQSRTCDSYRRSTERSVLLDQVLHVRLVKAKTSLLVMVLEGSQRASFVGKDINHDKRVSGAMSEHGVENGRRKAEEFRHAIMKDVTEGKVLLPLKGILKFDVDDSASFDAVDGLEVTDQRNAGGLGAPWRNISRAHIDIDGLVVAVSGRSGRGLLNGLENLLDTAENGSILGLEIEVVLPGAGKLGNLDRALIVDTLHELLNFRSRVARLADQDVVHCECNCEFKAKYALTLLRQRPVVGRKKNWRGSDKGGRMSGCGATLLRHESV